MELFCRETGTGNQTIIILHGLYGSSDNWMPIAQALAVNYRILIPDQRNHGQSPHQGDHTYNSLVLDLLELIQAKELGKVILLGHSMGGKTAMRFALEYPNLVDYLIVVDIAPKKYGPFGNYAKETANHRQIINSMLSVNPGQFKTRTQIDEELKKYLPDKTLRQFLMKNIYRPLKENYRWRLNLQILEKYLPEIMDGFSEYESNNKISQANIPSLFIRGEQSPYILNEDTFAVNKFFPGAQIVSIPNAGHWLHAQQPDLFIKTVLYFLE